MAKKRRLEPPTITGGTDITMSLTRHRSHNYRCHRGHEWEQEEPFNLLISDDPEYTTGPICPYCYIDWIKAGVSKAIEVTKNEPP